MGIGQNELSGNLRAGVGEGALHEGAAQDTAHHLWVGQQLALHLALEFREEARPAVRQAKTVQTFNCGDEMRSKEQEDVNELER